MGILDYIAEVSLDTMRPEYFSNSFQQHPNDDIALAHEDDQAKDGPRSGAHKHHFIAVMWRQTQRQDVLTADAVENFLRQYDIPVQTKEGRT